MSGHGKNGRGLAGKLALSLAVCAAGLLVAVPLLIMVFGSFKTSAEAITFSFAPPRRWVFENYVFVIQKGRLIRSFLNSLLITGVSVAAIVLFSALCAFVIARRENRLTRLVYWACLLGMVVPLQIVTTFAVLKSLGLMGSYLGAILVYVGIQLPWSVFIFTGFIRTVPVELDEAAVIDGASPLRMFFSVVVPLLQPVIATACSIFSMSIWNDVMIPLYFLNSDKWTMPLSVYGFFGQYMSDWNYVFADLMLTALPVVLLYLFAQKYIVSGMTAGSVKA